MDPANPTVKPRPDHDRSGRNTNTRYENTTKNWAGFLRAQ